MDKNLLFALDIGTRSVVGMILRQHTNGKYEVLHMKTIEHDERSMLDGQIHHIPAVAKVIKNIKNQLEFEVGPLNKVCVAAAGRALKTVKGRSEKDISLNAVSLQQEVIHMELAAVQQAQYQLASLLDEKSNLLYDCVGYSVLHYYLDDHEIGSFIGQQGNIASVEVIATFLPRVVVDSLMKALQEADLEMEALTLEPIAAINVLIPSSMRKLNVALVDIGAGTSDIAITAQGTVVAYGMVPIAGDEITEAVSSEFLLDFPIAEQMKRSLIENDEYVEYTDILGFPSKKSKDEVISAIENAIENLADGITREIIQLNAKAPQAVMLVGGGSLTPTLREKIAKKLNLPIERVAVRGINAIQSLIPTLKDEGPELVTPVGIGIAAKENPVKYVTVTVNGKMIRLFQVKKLTVGDALIAAGANLSKLYGKPGMGLMVRLNQKMKTFKGEIGSPPVISMNGTISTITDEIVEGAVITYEEGKNGEDAIISVKDAFQNHTVRTLYINGELEKIETSYYVNQQLVSPDATLKDRDDCLSLFPSTITDILDLKGWVINSGDSSFSILIDGKPVKLSHTSQHTLCLNGQVLTDQDVWSDGDHLTYESIRDQQITLKKATEVLDVNLIQSCTITFNGEEITLIRPLYTFYRDGEELHAESILMPNDELMMKKKDHHPFIFQDVFTQVELAIQPQPGESLVILKNNEKAGFQTDIQTGDHLILKFEVLV
ncbi:cell division FtsA domain-containing protein [Fictibacillus sp. b24]|uniref:cell division protein FtsA n=1 Tax=Fictibacillus sp. b24 TaxID=3055863 RepID=UPI0025A094E6|nr:cell division FtsA domain-containing protein [Fictibacillus sp. b24]MDM5315535.1 cell division FtsA domain-containing protein [Fictibacillus sp. b24]